MKLALCQLDSVWEAPEHNLKAFSDAVDSYVSVCGRPDIFLFPEFFNTAFTFNTAMAESSDGPTLRAMLAKARGTGCAIAGSILVNDGGKAFNRLYFVTEYGLAGSYDKGHTFSISGESEVIARGGDRSAVVNYRGWNIGLSICYDLRFPVWMRNEDNRYDLMINVASWPQSRVAQASAMAASRAIENTCYLAFCNRTGSDPKCVYDGRSAVYDFTGAVCSRKLEAGGFSFVDAEIDKSVLEESRREFPVWKDNDKFNIFYEKDI